MRNFELPGRSPAHGTMSLGEILPPAIGYIRDGYPILLRVAFQFANACDILEKNDNTKRVFMPGGRRLQVGERHCQPELAVTLQKIAEGGCNGTVKLTNDGKMGAAQRHVPVQQAHVTCCHISYDRFLSNR